MNIHFRRKQVCFKENLIRVSEGNYSIMVTGGNDSLVKVWKLWNKGKKSAQMEKMKTLSGHGESIMSVRFAQNGRIFVSTSGDKTLRIWHASNLVCLRVIEGHGRYGWDFVEFFSLNSLRFSLMEESDKMSNFTNFKLLIDKID